MQLWDFIAVIIYLVIDSVVELDIVRDVSEQMKMPQPMLPECVAEDQQIFKRAHGGNNTYNKRNKSN